MLRVSNRATRMGFKFGHGFQRAEGRILRFDDVQSAAKWMA